MTHLSDDDLESYHLGIIKAERELAPLEEHLFGCVFCALRAEAAALRVDAMRASICIAPNSYWQCIQFGDATGLLGSENPVGMNDPEHSWERVLAAGQRLVDAQAEEARFHRQYCRCQTEECRLKWQEARSEVDRLSSIYDAEMRLFRSTYLDESPA